MLLIIGVLISWNTFAQNTIKPSQAVVIAKENGKVFTPLNIFEKSTSEKNVVETIGDYTLLQLDVEKMQTAKYNATEEISISLPLDKGGSLQLELVKVDIYDANFGIRTSDDKWHEAPQSIHYRGVVKGYPNSIVAFSILDDGVTGLISYGNEGNLVLGARKGNKSSKEEYVLYNDKEVLSRLPAYCDTPDNGTTYTPDQLRWEEDHSRSAGDCVRVYLEIDHDVYTDKGGLSGTTDYVSAIFNQVATLYANESVSIIISEMMIWDTPSPYSGTSSGSLLTQFQSYRNGFNGDIAQLVSYQASGGIAVLSGLCHPIEDARMSFVSINSTYQAVPTYSFSVMVMAHELGHLLGSSHTHACVWNGDNTAIDGCAGFTEGNCANPGTPSGGGTIMSYCHITSTGINFNKGFGSQPGNVIRNMVANATCTSPCSTSGGGNNGGGNDDNCTSNSVYLAVTLDNYASENSWNIKDSNDNIVQAGGGFPKASAGQIVKDTICLPDGCYTFTMYDSYGDGMCCDYGNGGYILKDKMGEILAEGGDFPTSEVTDFCVPVEDNPNNGNGDCLSINFNDYTIDSYGGSQDRGAYQLLNNNSELMLQNNAWKSIDLEYEVTANTVIELEFKSTIEGEIHGIGFDNNNSISYGYTVKLHGSQNWGITDQDNYAAAGNWQSYTIPIGQYYQGAFDRLFFVADHDGSPNNGNSYFRNIRIHEGADCGQSIIENNIPGASSSNDHFKNVYPNPASDYININYTSPTSGTAMVKIISITGTELKSKEVQVFANNPTFRMDVSSLPQGAYFIEVELNGVRESQRFLITD